MAGRPLAVDLFCGLGGWTDGLLAEGYDVVGFDLERHDYGDGLRYPGQLVIQDVRTLHGAQFRGAALIVASPPCQEYSYMAMPWRRAKQIAAALRGEGDFPEGYRGSRTIAELNALVEACYRIQREASAAAGRHIPLVIENVNGAQPWIGPARWHHGSYYLWGDVPALMPMTVGGGRKVPGCRYRGRNEGAGRLSHTPHMTNPREHGVKHPASGAAWFDSGPAATGGCKRRAASALIAKIPFELARHIAAVYRPGPEAALA